MENVSWKETPVTYNDLLNGISFIATSCALVIDADTIHISVTDSGNVYRVRGKQN